MINYRLYLEFKSMVNECDQKIDCQMLFKTVHIAAVLMSMER